MTRRRIVWAILAAALVAFVIIAALQFTGGRDYSSDLQSLKTRFNADKGKPRLLILLSPT